MAVNPEVVARFAKVGDDGYGPPPRTPGEQGEMEPYPAAVSDTSDRPSEALSETEATSDQRKRRGSDTSDTSDKDADDEKLLAGVHDGAWLDKQEFAALKYAVDGLIPEGLTLLVGPPKAGKSWLILDLLLAVSSGGTALGYVKAMPPRRVLYLALEDGDRRMQDRCRKLLGTDAIPAMFSYKTRIMPGTVLATVKAWMRRHPDTALVVIDTLGKVMPPSMMGESSYQRDYRVGSALKELADSSPGLAVVILHHDRKASAEDFVDSVSATHGLAGAADTITVLCRKRQAVEGALKVTGRDVPENEYALTLKDGTAWQLAAADLAGAAAVARQREEAAGLSDRCGEVLAFVNKRPEGVRGADVVEVFGKDAYQYLKRLTEGNHINKPSRGMYAPLVLSEVSEVSDSQVTGGAGASDTLSEVSEASKAADLAPLGSDTSDTSDKDAESRLRTVECPSCGAAGEMAVDPGEAAWCKHCDSEFIAP